MATPMSFLCPTERTDIAEILVIADDFFRVTQRSASRRVTLLLPTGRKKAQKILKFWSSQMTVNNR